MSGTIFGIGLSQRVKSTGIPESGWRLFLYEAGTSTPVISYKDTGLTVGEEHPWPIVADASGTLPGFWLADGSYRVRGTSSDGGTVFYDLPSVLAIGASSGGGGGDTTSPDAIFTTGMPIWMPISGIKTGWIRMNGRTIGSATSGATERANADCQALFEYLWNGYIDAFCPVITGRGVSSAADWAANKQITPIDMRARAPFGVAGMGNSSTTDFDGLSFTIGGVDQVASKFGSAKRTLVMGNLPASPPAGTVSAPTITTKVRAIQVGTGASVTVATAPPDDLDATTTVDTASAPTFTGSNLGSSTPFDNMPTAMLGTWYQRL